MLRAHLATRMTLAAVGLSSFACFSEPDYTGQTCEESSGCPGDYRCVEGRCTRPARDMIGASSDGSVQQGAEGAGDDSLTGTISDDYLTAEGLLSIPTDMRNTKIAAVRRDPTTGTFETILGAGTIDGRFVIPRVPPGDVYVQSANLILVTRGRNLDLGRWFLGRPNRLAATRPTNLSLTIRNMDPWVEGDSIDLFTPNAFAFNWSLDSRFLTLTPGDTVLSGTFDYAATRGPFLVDASRGDVTYLTQLALDASSTGVPVSVLRRIHVIQGLRMEDGQALSIAGEFQDVPLTKSLQLKVCGAKLAALGSRVHPTAVPASINIDVRVNPVASAEGGWDGPRLVGDFVATSGEDTDLGTVRYGNPFPPDWPEYASVSSTFLVSGTGILAGVPLPGGYSVVPVADLPRVVCEPRLRPPLRPEVNGRDAFMPQTGVGTTPQFRWGAPAEPVSTYTLEFFDATNGAHVASILTSDTEVLVPPGVLEMGKTYVVQLMAISDEKSAAERLRAPFRAGLYFTRASAYLGPISP